MIVKEERMPLDQRTPDVKGPPLSCDCHLHVFGDPVTYPYSADRRNSPPAMPLAEYMAGYQDFARRCGIERMVFTQPSTYGRDNTCMIDAIKMIGDNARGIVDIDENVPDAELARLNSAGVVGIRVNLGPPNRPREAGLMEKSLARIQRLDARSAEIDWQLDILSPSWLIVDMLGVYKKLKSNFTLAHFGMFLARDGAQQPGLLKMLDFLRNGDGRCWVKLTAPYRMASAPGYADSAIIAKALIAAAPDRIIWGSDFPYLSHADKVNLDRSVQSGEQWMPDAATRHKILVDNPAKLFGFK
jgi:predicted TIM-barrel fold metal-dependent hydrolase